MRLKKAETTFTGLILIIWLFVVITILVIIRLKGNIFYLSYLYKESMRISGERAVVTELYYDSTHGIYVSEIRCADGITGRLEYNPSENTINDGVSNERLLERRLRNREYFLVKALHSNLDIKEIHINSKEEKYILLSNIEDESTFCETAIELKAVFEDEEFVCLSYNGNRWMHLFCKKKDTVNIKVLRKRIKYLEELDFE